MTALSGKVAVVTGGARGIGRAIAEGLAAAGARVVVVDIREVELSGGVEAAIAADVSEPRSVEWMAAELLDRFGGVDVLVNNAALFSDLDMHRPFTEIPLDEWRSVLDVNVTGPFLCSRALVPSMRLRGGGAILNLASGTVFRGTPYFLHYVTSKGAVVAFTRALARELGPDGITVNGIAPGFTLSEGVLVHPDSSHVEESREAVRRARSLQRDEVPEDLVGAAVFLCSPAAAFVTGQTLVVDGGLVMR